MQLVCEILLEELGIKHNNTLNALSASSNGTGRSSIVSRHGPQFLPEPIPSQDERTRFKAQLLTLILSTHRAKFL